MLLPGTLFAAVAAGLVFGGFVSAEPSPKNLVASRKAAAPVGTTLSSEDSTPKPRLGPPPSWVVDQKIPDPNPKHADDPFQFLLTDSQEYLTPSGVENFVEYAVQPLNQAGLMAVGNVQVPWNVERTDLTLNGVKIARNGKIIDALNRDDISVIRRETKLEESTLTGLRTVVLPVRDLEVGDELIVSFTYKTKPRLLGKIEDVQDTVAAVAVGRLSRRLVVSDDLEAAWNVSSNLRNVELKHSPLGTERDFATDSYEPSKDRKFVPTRFKHSLLQVSAYKSWNDVAQIVAPLFDMARKTGPDSDVTLLADKIASEHKDPQGRLLAALRTAQDDVRYVALLLGAGNYKPMGADEVWAKRFGDCKGKTAFILALLDRLAIEAEPVLASVQYDDGLAQQLPSLALMDHVYVRAHIGSETYYLDGTNFGQRTLEELRTPTTVHFLPLVSSGQLVTAPDVQPSAPTVETDLVWDARSGLLKDVPFEATLILRGSAAAQMRLQAATSTDHDKLITGFKDKVNGVQNDALEYVSSEPDRPDGSYAVHFKGKADLDWRPVDSLKGNRFQFNQSTLTWDGEFDRDDDGGKSIPVAMIFPYWERTVEKVILPNGGKDFTIDAPPVDQTIAVTRISRSVTLADGVATSISDFKRLGRELDPSSARAAKDPLKKISDDYAYIVSRKKLKLDN